MKFNLKGALFTSLGLITVVRCPCCGSPFCLNTLPFIGGAFVIGGLLPKIGNDNNSNKNPPEGGK